MHLHLVTMNYTYFNNTLISYLPLHQTTSKTYHLPFLLSVSTVLHLPNHLLGHSYPTLQPSLSKWIWPVPRQLPNQLWHSTYQIQISLIINLLKGFSTCWEEILKVSSGCRHTMHFFGSLNIRSWSQFTMVNESSPKV